MRNANSLLKNRWLWAVLGLGAAMGPVACADAPAGEDVASEGSAAMRAADPTARMRAAREAQARDPAAAPHVARVEAMRAELGLGADASFRPISVERSADHTTSVRLQQYHRGIKVRRGGALSHADAAGRFTHLEEHVKRKIDISTKPSVDEARALALVAADETHVAPYAVDPQIELVIEPVERSVYVDNGEPVEPEAYAFDVPDAMPPSVNAEEITRAVVGYRLAYEITTAEGEGGEHDSMRYLVDAQSGELLEKTSRLEHGQGTSLYNGSVSFNTLGTWNGGVGWEMYDFERNFTVRDDKYSSDAAPNVDSDDVWGDGQPFTSATFANRQTAMVDAIFGSSVYWDLLANVFSRKGPDGASYDVNVYVHYQETSGQNYDDAHYNPTTGNISCGDGPGNGFTRTTLDLMGHENAHGLNDFTAEMSGGEAGGLNESSSDIFGTLSKFYLGGGAFKNHASTIPSTGGNWVYDNGRDMQKPSSRGQPDAWYSGIDQIEVHDRGAPNNRAFYFLANGATAGMKDASYSPYLPLGMAGVGLEKAAKIWYRALTKYMWSGESYTGARNHCLLAAQDLFGIGSPEMDAVRNAYAGINVGQKAAGYPSVPNMAETEPNNSQAAATVISRQITQKVVGGPDKLSVFGKGTDNDWFVYTAKVGEKILARLTSAPSYDYDVYVYDELGSLLTKSAAAANQLDYVSWTAQSPWILPTTTATYYIKIVPYRSDANNSWYLLDFDFT